MQGYEKAQRNNYLKKSHILLSLKSYTSKRPEFGVSKKATRGPTLQEDRNALQKPYTKRPYFVLSENLNLMSNTSKSSDYDLNFETIVKT